MLDPLQHRVASLALHLPSVGRTASAGGAAMLAHGLVSRPTSDIDLVSPDRRTYAACRFSSSSLVGGRTKSSAGLGLSEAGADALREWAAAWARRL